MIGTEPFATCPSSQKPVHPSDHFGLVATFQFKLESLDNIATVGAGLYVADGTATIADCTIANNKAEYGAGAYLDAPTTITGTSLASNTASNGGSDYYVVEGTDIACSSCDGSEVYQGEAVTVTQTTFFVQRQLTNTMNMFRSSLFLVLACLLLAIAVVESAPPVNKDIDEALNILAKTPHLWKCASSGAAPQKLASSVMFYQLVCNGSSPDPAVALTTEQRALLASIGGLDWERTSTIPLVNLPISLTIADLTANPLLSVQPVVAQTLASEPSPYRQSVLGMAQNLQQQGRNALAGINGGYFFFLKNDPKDLFFDSNCFVKFPLNFENRSDLTTFDIGDGVHIENGQVMSWNCRTLGDLEQSDYPARAAFWSDSSNGLHIGNLPAGTFDYASQGIQQALSCGPMLLLNNSIDMQWQEIPSTFEYAASTAFVLATDETNGHQNAVFFTVDGADGLAGMHSYDMASFLHEELPSRFKLKPNAAFSMDQGGSTTMVVNDPVTNTFRQVTSSGEDRSVYDALFLFVDAVSSSS